MSTDPVEQPVPLSDLTAALSGRVETLAGEVAAARARTEPPAKPPTNPAERVASTVSGATLSAGSAHAYSSLADVRALRANSALGGVEKALTAARDALAGEPPESIPDDPSDLSGTEVAQALLIGDLLAVYDEERDEEGHLPNRSSKDAYARWATRRDELDPVVRQQLADLSAALETAADHAAPYLLPPAPEPSQRPERKHGSWLR